MKKYLVIGHFKGYGDMMCVAAKHVTKKSFRADCYGNGFVPYVIITEKMLEKLKGMSDTWDIFQQVKKMTSNYRKWEEITDYISQCMDIICEKMEYAY